MSVPPPPTIYSKESSSECLNCGNPNTENYCPRCGQEAGASIGPLREMALDAAGEFLHWDGKLIATLKGLLRPGYLTTRYLAGKRAAYITPFRLYLWVSALYFFVFSLTTMKEAEKQFDAAMSQRAVEPQQHLSAGIRQGQAIGSVFLPRQKTLSVQKPEERAKRAKFFEIVRNGTLKAFDNMALIFLFILPIEAFVLHLLYRRRQRWFAAHLVTIVHINAAILLLTCPLLFLQDKRNYDTILSCVIQSVYYFLALRQIYGGASGESWGKTLAKLLLFGLMLAVFFLVVMVGGGLALGIWFATHSR